MSKPRPARTRKPAKKTTKPADPPVYTQLDFDDLDDWLCLDIRQNRIQEDIPDREASRDILLHWVGETASQLLRAIRHKGERAKLARRRWSSLRNNTGRGRPLSKLYPSVSAEKRENFHMEQMAFAVVSTRNMLDHTEEWFHRLRLLCEILWLRMVVLAPDLARAAAAIQDGIACDHWYDDAALLRALETVKVEAELLARSAGWKPPTPATPEAAETNDKPPITDPRDGLTLTELVRKSHQSRDTLRLYAHAANVERPASGKRGTLIPWADIEKIAQAHIAANPNARDQWADFMKKHHPAMRTPTK